MKKMVLFVILAVLFLSSGVDAQTYRPMTSYVVPVISTGVTSFFTSAPDDFAGAWMTVSKGQSIRYYPRGTSGVTPYGGLIDQGDWYWISSRTEYDSAQFNADSSSVSGSSVFVTIYQK